MTEEGYRFAVIAESKNYDKPLYLHDLNFSKLMDDVVVPYQSQETFFIDGVPLKATDLKKIKIVRQKASFEELFSHLHHFLRGSKSSGKKVDAKDYPIRLEALFREAGDDVTSQIIKAFDQKIRPSLKEYLPKREELVKGAFEVFIEAMKFFAKGGA